jgi:hypothetical protein
MKRAFVCVLGGLLTFAAASFDGGAASANGLRQNAVRGPAVYRARYARPPCDNICRGPVSQVVQGRTKVVTLAPRVVRERTVAQPVRVIDHNRVILHRNTVIRRQPVIVHREVVVRPVIVHRQNVAHRYVTQHRTVTERRVVTRHVQGPPVHRYVRGITKVCPGGTPVSCRGTKRY